ncbi:hypothetical protein IPZ59_13155 [Mongoliitalea daihaiensis]|nr:hypothetical protein IPZ59_13155 [Mongoliitalea daihaiensis]
MAIILQTILLIFLGNDVFAQREYKGEYKFNGLDGTATFQFNEGAEGAVIKQGEFYFLRKEQDPDDKTRYYKTEINGIYNRDVKSGLWEYLDEDHQIDPQDVMDFNLIYDLKSSQIKIKANYSQGTPNGRWIFEENEFSEGVLRKKAEAEEFEFSAGDIKGKFQFKSFVGRNTHFIRGELKDGGIMHGEWTFVYDRDGMLISEIRNYENGFLIGLVQRDLLENEVLEEIVFFETIKKLKQINAEENKGFRIADKSFGIFFNDGFLSDNIAFQAQVDGNKFMADFLVKILQYDDQYVNPSKELKEYPIHTKKFVFELSRSQQRIIEELPSRFDQLKRSTESYKDRNALRLNRQRSDSLSFAYSFFDYQFNKLKAFDELMNLFKSKDIQFYDVVNMAEEGLSFLSSTDTIAYQYDEENRTRVVAYKTQDFSTDFFAGLDAYISEISTINGEYTRYVDSQLSLIEQDADLKELENSIKSSKDKLLAKFDSLENKDESTVLMLQAIKNNILIANFDKINERYAKAEKFAEKKAEADLMLDLIDEMSEQFVSVSRLTKNWEKLDEMYMENVFNPYVYTRYDQRTKARLFESAERLYEYYLQSIQEEQDYTQIKVWTRKVQDLILRMADLRNQDTRTIERKLNRRTSPSKIESALEL